MIDQDFLRNWIVHLEEMRIEMYRHLSFTRFVNVEAPAGTAEPPAKVQRIEDWEGYVIVYPMFPPMVRLVSKRTENDYKHYFKVAALQAYDWNSAQKIRLPAAMWIVYTAPAPIFIDLDNLYRKSLIDSVVNTGIIPDDAIPYLSSVGDAAFFNENFEHETFVFVFPLDRNISAADVRNFILRQKSASF